MKTPLMLLLAVAVGGTAAAAIQTDIEYGNVAGEILKLDAYLPDGAGPFPAVILVHAPPLGTPLSSDLGREVGDPEVAAAVLKLPAGSLVLSGHIHNPTRWCHPLGPAWCFNPGVDPRAKEPNHVIIDTTARTAEFHGWGSVQQASLSIGKE